MLFDDLPSTLARHTSSDKCKDKDNDKGLRALALIRLIRAHLSTPPLLRSVPQEVVPVQHRAQFVTKLFCRKKTTRGGNKEGIALVV